MENETTAKRDSNCPILTQQQYDELVKSLKNLNDEVRSLAEILAQKCREIHLNLNRKSSSCTSSSSGSRVWRKKRIKTYNSRCFHRKHHSRSTSCSTDALNCKCEKDTCITKDINSPRNNETISEVNTVDNEIYDANSDSLLVEWTGRDRVERNQEDSSIAINMEVNYSLQSELLHHFGENRIQNVPKNTDKNIFYSSEKATVCQICHSRFAFMVIHYKMSHPDSEVFVSRLSPAMAEMAKNNGRFVIRYDKPFKFDAFCYFCEKQFLKEGRHWIDHIRMHTGEYGYECLICGKESSSNRYPCCGQKVKQKIHFNLRYRDLTAFICRICNYVQINEENIRKHLKNEHQFEHIDGEYQQIILLTSLKKPKNFNEMNNSNGN